MVKHTLKILQQMQQDFQSVSDHFGTSYIKGLKYGHSEGTIPVILDSRETLKRLISFHTTQPLELCRD